MADRYIPQEIEPKWQARWEADRLYESEPAGDKPKYYILDFYPYPSGEGGCRWGMRAITCRRMLWRVITA